MKKTMQKARQKRTAIAERDRYLWLLNQIRSAPVANDGTRIFDLRLQLPPATTVEESIDLARHPFIEGSALTPCQIPVTKKKTLYGITACLPVTINGYEGFKFSLHREPGHRHRWHVTEFTSAASITNKCSSPEAAIEKARVRLSRYRPREFQQMLDSMRESIHKHFARDRQHG